MIDLAFTGQTGPYKAEIRVTDSLDYRSDSPADVYSVFTWHDNGEGVILWRCQYEIESFERAGYQIIDIVKGETMMRNAYKTETHGEARW